MELNSLRRHQGERFILKENPRVTKKFKELLDNIVPVVWEIDLIEVSHKGKVGYRMTPIFLNKGTTSTLVSWWVDDPYLDDNFQRMASGSLRFMLLDH